jgi:flagellar biosynthetic protein FliQ
VTVDGAIELFVKAMIVIAYVTGPMMIVALVIGLVIGVLQAATQINEASIAFVAKLLALALTLVILGPWMLRQMVDYTTRSIGNIAFVVK